jgi:lysyl-tRNA synthetase class 2
MEKESQLEAVRKQKLKELREKGINPYPYSFDQKHHAAEINSKYEKLKPEEQTKDKVSVAGRIMQLRSMGKIAFVHVQDQSGKVQLYFRENDLGKDKYKLLKKFDIGDIIGAKGKVFKTKKGEVTIYVDDFEMLTKSLLPLPEKWHGLKDDEIRYRQRELDLISNPKVKEDFMKRAEIYKAIREFMDKKGFMEVQTPILQTQYGGANARPFVTKVNAWDMKMYLRIAYEIHLKKLIVGGFEKIFSIGSCFRNEGVDKTHNPEFAMMEIQWAYKDYEDTMKITEELWEYVAKKVNGTTKVEYGGKKIDLKAPWKRIRMVDAIKKYAEIDIEKMSDDEIADFAAKHNIECKPFSRGEAIAGIFEAFVEEKLVQPTHIYDHPRETSPLAKPHRKDPRFVERVEAFINGWEVGNNYSELTDPIVQREQLDEQAKKGRAGDEEAHPLDESYITALKYGLPPNAGTGIGIDRMVMLLTGAESIRDVIIFPIMKPEE